MADDPVTMPPAEAPEESGELEIKLETGEVFRGSPDEIIEAMKHAQEETHRTLSMERDNASTLRQLVEQRGLRDTEQVPTEKQLKRMTPEERQNWFGRLALEPDAAVDELEMRRAGTTLREMAKTIESLRQDVEAQKQFGQVASFYNNAGIQEDLGKDGAALVVDRVRQENWPQDAEHLELAYYRLQKEGKLAGGQQQQQSTRRNPPPRLDGQGQRDFAVTEEQANNEPLEKLKRLIF